MGYVSSQVTPFFSDPGPKKRQSSAALSGNGPTFVSFYFCRVRLNCREKFTSNFRGESVRNHTWLAFKITLCITTTQIDLSNFHVVTDAGLGAFCVTC